MFSEGYFALTRTSCRCQVTPYALSLTAADDVAAHPALQHEKLSVTDTVTSVLTLHELSAGESETTAAKAQGYADGVGDSIMGKAKVCYLTSATGAFVCIVMMRQTVADALSRTTECTSCSSGTSVSILHPRASGRIPSLDASVNAAQRGRSCSVFAVFDAALLPHDGTTCD